MSVSVSVSVSGLCLCLSVCACVLVVLSLISPCWGCQGWLKNFSAKTRASSSWGERVGVGRNVQDC